MVDASEIEAVKRQLTKQILADLGIEKALHGKYSNIPSQAGQLIDEYGKYYRQLYKFVNEPYEKTTA